MIKLTLDPEGKSLNQTFEKPLILIGSDEHADIFLNQKDIHPSHLQIVIDDNKATIFNLHNDPFASINDRPFGKKTLKDKDIIKIDSITILYEEIALLEPLNSLDLVAENSDNFLANEELIYTVIEENDELFDHFASQANDYQNIEPIESIEETEILFQSSTDTLAPPLKKIEDKQKKLQILDEEEDSFDSPSKNTPNFEVGEFDDESENWVSDKLDKIIPPPEPLESSLYTINWKVVTSSTLAILLVLGLLGGALYFNKSARNIGEEVRAAEGVADIAMALKYAQIQHIKPHKKNWSDPEFIKNSLAQIIPHDYPSLTNINAQGHINHTSYTLRVYTSSDFSQFLVIAQPAPSLLQSFIPKTAIVVDSKLMELKKVVDIKTLNRLLVNSNNLDNSNAVEVTNLVKKGETILLSSLIHKKRSYDFSPPKALALIRPGSENYIYNAPRYYQMGETIIQRAIHLLESSNSPYELSRLKQEISMLSKMPDLVIYSSKGIEFAPQVQKAIFSFATSGKFLTAVLKLTNGSISGSHLMIDDEASHYKVALEDKKELKLAATAAAEIQSIAPKEQVPVEVTLSSKIKDVMNVRKEALLVYKNEINSLLDEDGQSPRPDFKEKLNSWQERIHTEDVQQKAAITKAIYQLLKEYDSLTIEEFAKNYFESGLQHANILGVSITKEHLALEIQTLLAQIETSENFKNLQDVFLRLKNWLQLETFADFNKLIDTQNMLKLALLDKVNDFLFSAKVNSLSLTFDQTEKNALNQLLNYLWIQTPEEMSFYLNAFDNLTPSL